MLLVHRPNYRDWSFPKGKLDPGEHAATAAVREVAEETGLQVALGVRLPDDHYTVTREARPGTKVVHYWTADSVGGTDVSGYRPNHEIDELRWVGLDQAYRMLSYDRDRAMLRSFADAAYDSCPLLVVRHAAARDRRTWRGDDDERPLSAEGERDAERLLPVLRAFDVRVVWSSHAVRCLDTVLPYVEATGAELEPDPHLSEHASDSIEIKARLDQELGRRQRVAVCSHRPVLPLIFAALGQQAVKLEPGGVFVAHRRDGQVVAGEHLR